MSEPNIEFPYVVRLYWDENCGHFIGSGVLVGPRHVVTCAHVVDTIVKQVKEFRKKNLGFNGSSFYGFAKCPGQRKAVRVIDADYCKTADGHADPWSVDLALLELDVKVCDAGAPILHGLDAKQFRAASNAHQLWTMGGAELGLVQTGVIRDIQLDGDSVPCDIQVGGGIPAGFSGGAVVARFDSPWMCVGIARMGREEATASRFITSDQVVRFLRQNKLHQFDFETYPLHEATTLLPAIEVAKRDTLLRRHGEFWRVLLSGDAQAISKNKVNRSGAAWQIQHWSDWRLDRYVWPGLAWEDPNQMDEHGQPLRDPIPGDKEEPARKVLETLLTQSNVVLYDDAGMGKTAFTLKLIGLLFEIASSRPSEELPALAERPPLVVRIEGNWPREQATKAPLGVVRMLQEETERAFALHGEAVDRAQIAAAVDDALQARRVVLLVDAFDQMNDEDRQHVAKLMSGEELHQLNDAARCAWFLTGRPYALRQYQRQLEAKGTKRLRLSGLSPDQQDAYFHDLEQAAFFRDQGMKPLDWVCESREELQDDLTNPFHLREIRRLIERSLSSTSRVGRISTTGELRARVASALLNRACEQTNRETPPRGIHPPDDVDDQHDQLLHVCGLLAFQLMLEEKYNASVDNQEEGGAVRSFLTRAQQRFFASASESVPAATMQSVWDWAIWVLKKIEFSHRRGIDSLRGDIDSFNRECRSFRDRKTMEWYAAHYLVNHATRDDLYGYEREHSRQWPCALDFVGNAEWDTCWQQAIAMPQNCRREPAAGRSLGLLFELPRKANTRPCELMWRALAREYWRMPVDQRPQWSERLPWLARYRQQFEQILLGQDVDRARLAAQLVPEFVLDAHVATGRLTPELREKIAPATAEPAYCECPKPGALRAVLPSGDAYLLWQGTDPHAKVGNEFLARKGEKPRHPQIVRRFWLQSTTVTRAQYGLFDPQHDEANRSDYDSWAKHGDCPVIEVDWHDAVMFALWVGARLPTESEWEFACRAGHDGEQEFFGIGKEGRYDRLSSQQANFAGGYPFGAEQPGDPQVDVEETLPVRWTKARRKQWLDALDATRAKELGKKLSAYAPNEWGLWQMHGNVWEWCVDVYDVYDELYTERARELLVAAGERVQTLEGLDARELATKIAELTPEQIVPHVLACEKRATAGEFDSRLFAAGSSRVVRGGSWLDNGGYLRCAGRYDNLPAGRELNIGFRLSWVARCRVPSRPLVEL